MRHNLLVILISIPFNLIAQEELPDKLYTTYSIPGIDSLTILLPYKFDLKEKDYYGEGFFLTFSNTDGSFLFFHWGFLMNLPFIKNDEKHIVEDSISIGSIKRRQGVRIEDDNMFTWREDNYGKVNLFYFSKDDNTRMKLDYVLDDFYDRYHQKK